MMLLCNNDFILVILKHERYYLISNYYFDFQANNYLFLNKYPNLPLILISNIVQSKLN